MNRDQTIAAHRRLHEHVRFLHAFWYMFRRIFRAPEDRQKLLNVVVPQFFVLLEKTTIRTIFLEFRLITEKPVTMGRRNASLRGLLQAIHGDAWEKQEAATLVTAVEQNNTVRHHVNRVIAHIDWNTAAGVDDPPGPVAVEEVEEALEQVRQAMKHIAEQLGLPVLDYTGARIDGEVDTLFRLLASTAATGNPEVH
jgi:hypothetical protein